MILNSNNLISLLLLMISTFKILLTESAKIEIDEKTKNECEAERDTVETEMKLAKPEMCQAACYMKALNLMNAKGKVNIPTAKKMIREYVPMKKWQEGYDVVKQCSRKANKGGNKCVTADIWMKCSESQMPSTRLQLPSIFDLIPNFLSLPTLGILTFLSF